MKPVADLREQMTVVSGLALRGAEALGDGGGDHARAAAAFLTGAHPRKTHGSNIQNGQSVDQVAASTIGSATRLKSLELGTEESAPAGTCDTGYSCLYTSNISWRTPQSPLAKEVDPAAVFDRLFGMPGGGAESLERRQQRQRRTKSVLDHARGQARRLSDQLGANDRRKLDEYLYGVREIELRLAKSEKLDQVETDIPDYPRPAGVPENYAEHVRLLMDMMVLAFQTDATRVASFMFANASSNRTYTNLDISEGHHNISHHGGAREKQKRISKINQFHMSLTGHLVRRLAAIPEGDATVLDNSLILYGSGISDGNSHDHSDLPICVFGRGGGTVESGRHLRVRPRTPLTNLYRSMLAVAGAPVDSFSDSSGEIDGFRSF